MVNKYDQFHMPTPTLIRAIQDLYLRLEDKDQKKKISSDRASEWRFELRDMRHAVVPRLKALDRKDPTFFPIRSRVGYSHTPGYEDEGVVVHRDKEHVYVKILEGNGKDLVIRCSPLKLRLKYIT